MPPERAARASASSPVCGQETRQEPESDACTLGRMWNSKPGRNRVRQYKRWARHLYQGGRCALRRLHGSQRPGGLSKNNVPSQSTEHTPRPESLWKKAANAKRSRTWERSHVELLSRLAGGGGEGGGRWRGQRRRRRRKPCRAARGGRGKLQDEGARRQEIRGNEDMPPSAVERKRTAARAGSDSVNTGVRRVRSLTGSAAAWKQPAASRS